MIRRELAVFLVVGTLAVLTDFCTYRALVLLGWAGIAAAKAAGFIAGAVFAYFANRWWTFGGTGHAPGSLYRFALLYGLTLGANVTVNTVALNVLEGSPARNQLAFLLATGASTVLNFLGLKLFVFRSHPVSDLS